MPSHSMIYENSAVYISGCLGSLTNIDTQWLLLSPLRIMSVSQNKYCFQIQYGQFTRDVKHQVRIIAVRM